MVWTVYRNSMKFEILFGKSLFPEIGWQLTDKTSFDRKINMCVWATILWLKNFKRNKTHTFRWKLGHIVDLRLTQFYWKDHISNSTFKWKTFCSGIVFLLLSLSRFIGISCWTFHKVFTTIGRSFRLFSRTKSRQHKQQQEKWKQMPADTRWDHKIICAFLLNNNTKAEENVTIEK